MKRLRIGWFWFFCLLIAVSGVLFFNIFRTSTVATNLNSIPKKDREQIDWFFRLLFQDTFPFVLFGNKPMGICFFLDIDSNEPQTYYLAPILDLPCRLCLHNLKANKGWETWKKYSHLFPSSNYTLIENRDSECITIVAINKRSFLKTAEENIDRFRIILGADITPDIVLDRCLQSNNLIKNVLKDNDELLGILLGFGKHNAHLFSRKSEIEHVDKMRRISLSKKPPTPSSGFSTIDEEYQHIDNVLTSFNNSESIPDFNSLFIDLPSFRADPSHPETRQLKEEYIKQYKHIMAKYKKGDFLEITLSQFCK